MRTIAVLLALVFVANVYASDVDDVFGQKAKVSGDVQRYGWPRSDLHVTIHGVAVKPALALGSWAGFMGNMVMGDLVLKTTELDRVARELEGGGFEICAMHNHLSGETPRVVYLHYAGHGDPVTLAKTLKAALATTSTPMSSGGQPTPAVHSKLFDEVSEVLAPHKGTVNGPILAFAVPRAEEITEGGMTLPPAMGVATSVNFQTVGSDRVATTGDFVLIADEVNPVIRELQAKGIEVTALHSHMLRETPRLFFMHFWGVGAPRTIAEGIRNALGKMNAK